MAKIRVYELATCLGITNSTLLRIFEGAGFPVKSHMSSLSDDFMKMLGFDPNEIRGIYWLISKIHFNIEALEKYLESTTDFFINEKEFFLNFKEELDSKDDQFETEMTSWEVRDKLELNEKFLNILRESFFISCFAFFEQELTNLCKYIEKTNSNTLSISDLKGMGIDRAKNYLKKVANLNLIDKSVYWKELKNYQKLRNIITHNKGRLDADRRDYKGIVEYINNNIHLNIDKDQILITNNFLSDVITTIRHFLNEVFSLFTRNTTISDKAELMFNQKEDVRRSPSVIRRRRKKVPLKLPKKLDSA